MHWLYTTSIHKSSQSILKLCRRCLLCSFLPGPAAAAFRRARLQACSPPPWSPPCHLRAAAPAAPAAPPPAFLVLGQRPGSSPGEPHQTAAAPRRPLRPSSSSPSPPHAAPPAHATPVHAAPHTPPCHPRGRPTHAPGPFAAVRLPRSRLPRAPALARRYCQGRCAFERTPPCTAGAPVHVHDPPPSPPTRPPCVVYVRAAAASCVCAWAWSGCAVWRRAVGWLGGRVVGRSGGRAVGRSGGRAVGARQ